MISGTCSCNNEGNQRVCPKFQAIFHNFLFIRLVQIVQQGILLAIFLKKSIWVTPQSGRVIAHRLDAPALKFSKGYLVMSDSLME